jgi:hypothetical protein
MIVAVQGSRNFNDYNIFLRAMGTALHMMESEDGKFVVYSAGPAHINSMAQEFVNVSERGLKARGIRTQLRKVPPSWLKENLTGIDYIAFFSKPKEPLSDFVKYAEDRDAEIGVYRY